MSRTLTDADVDAITSALRTVIREEIRAVLGVDQTEVEKLAALPLAERKAVARARRAAQKKQEQLR